MVSQTFNQLVANICEKEQWKWTKPLWGSWELIYRTGDSQLRAEKVFEKLFPKDILELGCVPASREGRLNYLFVDFDVKKGSNGCSSPEEALEQAVKLDQYFEGCTEIRRSKGGQGAFSILKIPEGVDIRIFQDDPQTGRKLVNSHYLAPVINKLGLKADAAPLGRQARFLWCKDPGPNAFELLKAARTDGPGNDPQWFECKFQAARDEIAQSAPQSAEPCQVDPRIIDRARKFIMKFPDAVSGQGGHDATYRVACELIQGFSLPKEVARPLLHEWNDKRCTPKWSAQELEHKLDDAAKAEGPRGRRLVEDDNKSQATVLVELVKGSPLYVSMDCPTDGYIEIQRGGYKETMLIKGSAFSNYLTSQYFWTSGKAVSCEAVKTATSTINANAIEQGKRVKTAVRIAKHGDKIYLDFGRRDWKLVEVDSSGWRIVDSSPVKFIRPASLKELPLPENGGNLNEFKELLNLEDSNSFTLVMGALLCYLNPDIVQPILIINGVQGSAKTTMCKIIKRCLDPNVGEVMAISKNEQDLMIQAKNNWILPFDNLSYLNVNMSDALCRMSTGGAFSTRKLYTDSEETIMCARRPVLLNGIPEIASRGDLLERSICLNLPAIPEDKRMTEEQVINKFNAMHPKLLGLLLTIVSGGINNFGNVKLEKLPRLADVATWVTACEPGLGLEPGTFVSLLLENQGISQCIAIESSVVGQALVKFVKRVRRWEGTPSELLEQLRVEAMVQPGNRLPNNFPSISNKLGSELKRLKPALERVGIIIEESRSRNERKIIITFSEKV